MDGSVLDGNLVLCRDSIKLSPRTLQYLVEHYSLIINIALQTIVT